LILYRISNHADLTGKGGELAEGRWHTQRVGKRIVYLSDHPALCLVEMLVHIERETDLPDTFQLLSVEVPDHLLETLDQSLLPVDWQQKPRMTQKIGDEWLEARRSMGLIVPSAIVPNARNCLLNPLVPETSNLEVKLLGRFPLDRRLLKES
jgi:RES domain-containing protein